MKRIIEARKQLNKIEKEVEKEYGITICGEADEHRVHLFQADMFALSEALGADQPVKLVITPSHPQLEFEADGITYFKIITVEEAWELKKAGKV